MFFIESEEIEVCAKSVKLEEQQIQNPKNENRMTHSSPLRMFMWITSN